MPVMAFMCPLQSEAMTVCGLEADALVQPSKDDELLIQTVAVLQHWLNTMDEAVWSVMVMQKKKMAVFPCCGYIIWYSTLLSLYTTLFYSLVPYTHHCCSSMLCMSRNLWQACFLENNNSAQFELNHVLILHPSCLWGMPALALMFPLHLEALHWLS